MKKKQIDEARKRRAKAWGITIGIHLLLLVVFLIWKYDLPYFHFEEEPIEVALGTDMDGFGEDPDQAMDAPAQEEANKVADRGASSSQRHIDASDDENVPNPVKVQKTNPAIKQDKKDNNKPVANQSKNTTNSRTAQQTAPKQTGRYVMNNSSGQGGNSAEQDKKGSGSGTTQGSGTQGSPGGSPTGKGRMTTAVNLRDRVIERAPNPNATYNQGGQVTVRVTVNRQGVITKYDIRSSSNATIRRIAEEKVQQIRFNASSTALPEQSGDIIFRF